MKRFLIVLTILFSAFLFDISVHAGTATSSLTVTANASDSCVVSTTLITFSPYDGMTTHNLVPDNSIGGAVIVQCATGTVATIGMGNGSNYQNSTANMKGSGSALLPYATFQDAARGIVWGNTSATWLTTPSFPNTNPQSFPIYAQIPAHQTVPNGTYNDTVTVTVNF